jgi:hypothetical protein
MPRSVCWWLSFFEQLAREEHPVNVLQNALNYSEKDVRLVAL